MTEAAAPAEVEAPGEPETPAPAVETAPSQDAAEPAEPATEQPAAPADPAESESQPAEPDPDAALAPAAVEPPDTVEPEAPAAEAAEPADATEADTAEPDGIGEDGAAGEDESGSPWTTDGPLNVVVVADLDFISEQFFQIREVAPGNLNFDNVTFFLNAIDSLLEDDSFIGLRSRRARHRTLEQVEAQTAEFIEQRTIDEQQAEAEAEQALTDAQTRLNERVDEVQNRTDIDAQAKQIMARNLEEVENRRLSVLSANIETEKETKVRASLERMETQIRRIQSSIKTFAILLPPVPVFALGVAIFVRRQRREREGAAAARRLRD